MPCLETQNTTGHGGEDACKHVDRSLPDANAASLVAVSRRCLTAASNINVHGLIWRRTKYVYVVRIKAVRRAGCYNNHTVYQSRDMKVQENS